MNQIEQIAQSPHVRVALDELTQIVPDVVELAISIQQIPAPTFAEKARAGFIESLFKELSLVDVYQDELHNVYGRIPGQAPHQLPPLVVSAHTDTVFPIDTDLTIKNDGRLVYGPGLGDNATGVAGLLTIVRTLQTHSLSTPTDIWFVANVGEEGLGDLRGMKAVVEHFGIDATYIVLEGGMYGQICYRAIGVRRYQITVEAPGGHSWGAFGTPSAIHVLGHLIVAIDDMQVPTVPKTTYNIGIIEGGRSINTIAQTASLLLDLRSEDTIILDALVTQVKTIVAQSQSRFPEVTMGMTLIGNRPAGQMPDNTPLIHWAQTALQYVGCEEVLFIAGSTDANIPLSKGGTAVCVGITESSHAHRLDEYIDTTYIPQGLSQLLLLILAAADFK